METVLYEVAQGVATITLNRPDKLNSFNEQMGQELQQALREAERDAAVRALLFTGAGRAFSAGQDLAENQADREAGRGNLGDVLRRRYNPIMLKVRTIEKPVIAAVNGVAAGAGCSLALAADLRLASERASFLEAFVRVGLVPDSGASFLLPRLVGFGKAMELAMTGEPVPAEEAVRIGLCNRVVPHDQLMTEAKALAQRLAAGPRSVGLIKRTLNAGLQLSFEEVLAYEAMMQEVAGNTDDHHEGMAAFLEKRPPHFTGR